MFDFDTENWNNTDSLQEGEFVRLPAGGYVCVVLNASIEKSQQGNLQLILTLDIAEGDFVGTFKDSSRPPKYFKPLFIGKEKDKRISPYFKGLIQNFITSNPTFKFNGGKFDERNLIGKRIGMIFRDEQRVWKGKIYTDAKPYVATIVEKIRDGDFTVPPMKTVDKPISTANQNSNYGFSDDEFTGDEIADEKVPF